jgi:hypothetical protein
MALKHQVRNTFDILVKNQMMDEKKESRLESGVTKEQQTYRSYRSSLINRTFFAIGLPVFVWLVLETFFK